MDITYNLCEEMQADSIVIKYLENFDIATEFYRALCNMRWRKINALSDEEQIVNKLKGIEPHVCSYSWRSAGSIIAEIRYLHYNKAEDYMTFYCLGSEGLVSELVKNCFKRMNWEEYPWD